MPFGIGNFGCFSQNMPFGIYTNTLRGYKISVCPKSALREGGRVIPKGGEMKKIARKIATTLILVILASMIMSCLFTFWAVDAIKEKKPEGIIAIMFFPLWPVLDLLLWPFELIWMAQNRSVYPTEDMVPLTEEEYALLTAKTASLPEEDAAFLMAAIASLPEAERAGALDQINSVPEQQFVSVIKAMRALYTLPQADRVFLVDSMRSLPEEEKAYLTETANSLTDEEIAAMADEISSIPSEEMARQIEALRETPSSEWGYREYAAERFVTLQPAQ